MKVEETRVLIRRGRFSNDVVLPRWWLKGNRLAAGSKIHLVTTPEKIIITPETEANCLD